MSSARTISLHLGVHKTATTYMQSRLYNSRDLLKEHNIGYIPLYELRSHITSHLSDQDFTSNSLFEALKPYSEYERIIISDENIIGGTNKPLENKIYSDARQRLSNIIGPLSKNYNVEVFLTLRDYSSYFVSRYTEYLRHFPFQNFGSYYSEIDITTVSWLDLIADIKEAGGENIFLTPFESLFKDERKYIGALLGNNDLILHHADDKPSTRRAKFSQQGYEVVEFFANHYAPAAVKKIMNIIDVTPQTTSLYPFMPLSNAVQEMLLSRYKLEISNLKLEL